MKSKGFIAGLMTIGLAIVFAVLVFSERFALPFNKLSVHRVTSGLMWFEVQVLDATNHRPLAGAVLKTFCHNQPYRVTTNAEGKALIQYPAGAKIIFVQAEKPDYAPQNRGLDRDDLKLSLRRLN